MTIFIWDNGEDYRDHHIEFISTDGLDGDDVLHLIEKHRGMKQVIAIVEAVDWRDPEALTDVVNLPGLIPYAIAPDENLGPLKFETIQKLLQRWRNEVASEVRRLRKGPNPHYPQPKLGRKRAILHLERMRPHLNAVKDFLETKVPKCPHCNGEGLEAHTCPYQSDVNDDHETLCNCCADCEHECLMDI